MNCFTHQDTPAVAICRNCGKGLCGACALDSPAGVSCGGECAQWAEVLHLSVRRYKGAARQQSRSTWMSVFLFGGVGIVMLMIVAEHLRESLPFDSTTQFLALLGALFLAFGVMLSFAAVRMRGAE